MNVKRRVLTALLLACAGGACMWFYAEEVAKRATGGAKVEVLIAAQELAPGTRIEKKHLAVHSVPEAYVHAGAVRRGEEDELLGRLIGERKVNQGQPFMWTDFELERSGSKRVSSHMQKGQRAFTFPADVSSAHAGMIRPGDHVDVLASFVKPVGTAGAGQYAVVTLMQNIPVLAIGTLTAARDANHAASENGGALQVASLTVSVDPEEAELLFFAQQRGQLGYVMRPVEDLDAIDALPEKSFSDIFEPEKRVAFTKRHAHKKRSMIEALEDK